MKITTTKDSILSAVLLAEKIVGKKESLQVLSCVLFDVGERCVIRATNLEAGIEIEVPCEITEGGKVAVRATILSQTLRTISGGKILFRVEEGNLIIESKGTKTLIKAVPHDEFPTLGGMGKGGILISRDAFMRGIKAVAYAASPSMIRPELGSVYVSIRHGVVTCVATDSFRLAEKVISGVRSKIEIDLLIPLKHALELVYILESVVAEEVELSVDESQMSVSIARTLYISRVVDGTFPNYKEIIPQIFTTEVTLLKGDLMEMLRKARVFSGNDQHVGLHVYPKRKIFSATARSADVGEMSDSIDAAIMGEDVDINFHIGYLADCIPVIESDSVLLCFAGVGKPLVIRGVSDASFRYLVMPLNR